MSDRRALEIRGLRKTYDSGVEALRGIDLEVEEGAFFGLLGPNGAGKSTTIGILTSLIRKTAGSVSVFGMDLDRDPLGVKRAIGVVPQEVNFNLFERPEQILVQQAGYYGVPARVARRRALESLEAMGLMDKKDQPSRGLSGGMKRRLMIARALVHQPRLLILDEPTAGVDIELRRTTWAMLEDINRSGVTIILTTHYLEEAETLCERIGIIDEGRLLLNRETQSLLAELAVETFVLDPVDALAEVPHLEGFETRRNSRGSIEVDLPRGQNLDRVFEQLADQGLRIRSMRNKANRLEELFVRLTESERAATDLTSQAV
ncbi:MAG: ABC transporter ATP-binding protein [Acidobacteriota bacterium]